MKKRHMCPKKVLVYLLILIILAGCTLNEPPVDTSAPEPETDATPTPESWSITYRNPRSGMFGIAWNPGDRAHPLLTYDRLTRELYALMYDSLFVLDQDFNIHERLCRSVSSDDNQVFTLSLRDGVYFNNGEPLTVNDVISSIEIARSPASPYSARLSRVTSVTAADEGIVITLSEPNPRFAALLTFPIVSADNSGFPWAGTGYYTYEAEEEEDRHFLVPFAGHWENKNLPLGHIELVSADKPEYMTYLMGTGDVSIVTTDANDDYAVLFGGDYDIWEYPTPTMYYIGFNTSHPLLSDNRVRKALSSVFDREGLATKIFGRAADAVVLPVPPSVRESGSGFDLMYFASVMEELGIEDVNNDGFLDFTSGRSTVPFTVRIITDEQDTRAALTAIYLARELLRAGVNVIVTPMAELDYKAAISNGEYEMYCDKITLTADFPLTRWLNPPTATGTSITDGYSVFLDEMPIAPLVFKREYALTHWSEVSGIKPIYGNPYVNITEWTVKQ
ncbi:MAG: ABC transporter substrate-binding protein [Oscillospiraceae bacterium]|nr:ABC transporter substrate-binding protein [Oscillospiraceae bacterium]